MSKIKKIQSTRILTPVEFNSPDGYKYDFDTSMKYCVGIAVLYTTANIDYTSSIEIMFGSDIIMSKETPIFMLQCNASVNSNDRFFFIEKTDISNKKFVVKSDSLVNMRIMFLLENE